MNSIEEANHALRTICFQCKHHEKPSGNCLMQNNGMVGCVHSRRDCPLFKPKYVTWVTSEPPEPPVLSYQRGEPIHPSHFTLHVGIKLSGNTKIPGYLFEVTKGEFQGFYWFKHDWIERGHIELVASEKQA